MFKKFKLLILLFSFMLAVALFSFSVMAKPEIPETADKEPTASQSTKNGWEKNSKGQWLYYKKGIAQVGWLQDNSKWYFLNNNGIMVTGWLSLNDTWYYLNPSGAMATGWLSLNGTWYYLHSSGAMATGWLSLNGTWYYLHSSGAMATGWLSLNGTWYYLHSSGAMATGWLSLNGTWYYLNPSGAMVIGWELINDIWYYFNFSGALLDDSSAGLINVDFISQNPELPTGCELVALTMLLNHNGTQLQKDTIAKSWISISNNFYTTDGIKYGPNPYTTFVGDPFSEYGWGCYDDYIVETANKILQYEAINKSAVKLTGCYAEDLYNQIDQGNPVLLWATVNMSPFEWDYEWYTEDGRKILMSKNEHCMLLVGYDKDFVTINDPLCGIVKYPRSTFEQRFAEMGRQAVIIK